MPFVAVPNLPPAPDARLLAAASTDLVASAGLHLPADIGADVPKPNMPARRINAARHHLTR